MTEKFYLDAVTEQIKKDTDRSLSEKLEEQVSRVLDSAIHAHYNDLKVYQSLQNLNEVIGTEYSDRVLYELIQNAHDAHRSGGGRIAIELDIKSESEGVLYVANGGDGFRWKDVEAIMNLAASAKKIGEGIGNKGLGFRSIEALTNDVNIYSRNGKSRNKEFDGFCFRFANTDEIDKLIRAKNVDESTSAIVAQTLPRYLLPLVLEEQPDDIKSYARRDYATVITAPLGTAEAVSLAMKQVEALADLDVPILLFLDRIAEIRIEIKKPDEKPYLRRLSRRQKTLDSVASLPNTYLSEVVVGKNQHFLVIRREIDKSRIRETVKRSIPSAPQLKRWLDWKGTPAVSVAVGLDQSAVKAGRLYNFLPMGDKASSPFSGYLDAPFFTDIDRRDADFDLPLNEMLMEVAAETCADVTLSIVEQSPDIPSSAVFDLFAWTGHHADKLDEALIKQDSSLLKARVIPAIADRGRKAWSCLNEIRIWPKGNFSILKDRAIVKHVGAQLVSSELDSGRIDRLKEIARHKYLSLVPSGDLLAKWSEDYACSLVKRKAATRTWARFYDDLPRVFDAAGTQLKKLDEKNILYIRSGKLRPAGKRIGVFVRNEIPKGRRKKDGMPLPPKTLARRFHFLDDRIKIRSETLKKFIDANLVREYDPVEALVSLKSALDGKANEGRRKEVLLWAFQVWRAAPGARLEEVLQQANLYVPTFSGWHPAGECAFSSSWTPIGKGLENYLTGASSVSPDCRRACDSLLVGQQNWPASVQNAKRDWIRFLELIGVADGLRPVPARIMRKGSPSNGWNSVLRNGKDTEGLDADWCEEVAKVCFRYPYTEYEIKGEAWRLPGQVEHEALSESDKELLSMLVFEHLKVHGTKYFEFEVGRFGRHKNSWNRQVLPTPLATFLRSHPWIAANAQEGLSFRSPGECWGSRVRRGGLPRFVTRLPELVAGFTDGTSLAELVFGEALGLRDWYEPMTAVERLRDLASVAQGLPSNDRPTLRNECRRAWQDVVVSDVSLPKDLRLVVTRRGRIEPLIGNPDSPASVIVSGDAQRFEARTLSSAGQAVLDVGPVDTGQIATLLEETGIFAPKLLNGIGVQLLVDGEPFVPRDSDPPLIKYGLQWLPEVMVIGHDVLGEQLERGIQTATVDRRTRAIRVRFCDSISLVVEDEKIPSSDEWSAFEDNKLPTLILTNGLTLNWQTLARDLSRDISRLVDTRLRSIETLLLRLSLYQSSEELDAPSNEVLANALGCDLQTVIEHRAALRTNSDHILHLLIPLVAYYGDLEISRKLINDFERDGNKFNVRNWLEDHISDEENTPEKLIQACEYAEDRSELRRHLKLDYERFNRMLSDLGEERLSNEDELRALYKAYLQQMRPQIIDRLRNHYFSDFCDGLDLSSYIERKNLDFLEFNQEWIFTRETLDKEIIETHVSGLLLGILGEDVGVDLMPFNRVLEMNRKKVSEFAKEAMPIIGIWCRKNQILLPEAWKNRGAHAVVQYLENSGLLDFKLIEPREIPAYCQHAGCWPDGMAETLDGEVLGFSKDDVKAEEKRREEKQREREIEQRSITFAGTSLDTGDPGFAATLQEMAESTLANNNNWFDRSRQRTRLMEFNNPVKPGGVQGGGGRSSGTRRQQSRFTDTQRLAMGLASEWLAYQFLCRRHHGFVDETCWISTNRAHFFGGGEGDDSAGFDFRVNTPHVEWLYEVKSSLEDSAEFELTANEVRVASSVSKDGRRRYRILYVPYVFSPEEWHVLELPNPMGDRTRNCFSMVGSGSIRLRFERF